MWRDEILTTFNIKDLIFLFRLGYQEVQSGIETSRYVFYEEKTICNKGQARYRTELAEIEKYPLDEGFVADACRLTAAYDENLYMYFLEDWGTVRWLPM